MKKTIRKTTKKTVQVKDDPLFTGSKRELSHFEEMVKNRRGLCQIILFVMLDPKSLAKFAQISKDCNQLLDPRSKNCVNFKVLFEAQGIKLTLADV